jgi:hypothetical protein
VTARHDELLLEHEFSAMASEASGATQPQGRDSKVDQAEQMVPYVRESA